MSSVTETSTAALGKQGEMLFLSAFRGAKPLKPSDVKVRSDGQVKILDFGLAKAFEGETGEEEIENSPPLSAVAIRMRVLLGTAVYMSPEQARGKRVGR